MERGGTGNLELPLSGGPLLVVLSGPSGAGKDAVREELERRGHPFHFAVTATTRAPRRDERDGVDYHYLDEAAFQQLVDNDGLLEHERYDNGSYGVPRDEVARALAAGRDVIVRVDVRGARSIRRLVPRAVLIFIAPPDLPTLERRMRRPNQTAASLRNRLQAARTELACMGEFDYVVVNRDGALAAATDQVEAIMTAERCRVGREPAMLEPGNEQGETAPARTQSTRQNRHAGPAMTNSHRSAGGPKRRVVQPPTDEQWKSIMSAIGGWKGLIDPEQLKRQLDEERSDASPPVDFDV